MPANIPAISAANDSGVTLDSRPLLRLTKLGFRELPGYSENWESNDNDHVVRVFEGPWSQKSTFKNLALGICSSYRATAQVGDNIVPIDPKKTGVNRLLPIQHPEYPWLYATAVRDLVGQGAFTQNLNIKDDQGTLVDMLGWVDGASGSDELSCRMAVHFAPLNYEIRTDAEMASIEVPAFQPPPNPDGTVPPPVQLPVTELYRYVDRSQEYAIRSLPIPVDQLFFTEGPSGPGRAGGAMAVPANAGYVYVPTQELTYTWYRVPDPPVSAFAACQGKVNAYPFDAAVTITDPVTGTPRIVGINVAGYAPETLLFTTPHKVRSRGPSGRAEWTITYKMLYNPLGWNKLPDGSGGFYRVGFNGDPAKPLYQLVDFSSLFLMDFNAPFDYQ